MKIGILTFHRAHNYGAVLQCYALQVYLLSLGHDVSVIDYRPHSITQGYYWCKRDRFIRRNIYKAIKEFFLLRDRYIRFNRFNQFINEKLNLCSLDSIKSGSFDLIVIGSDQVWNHKLTSGFDNYYWGNFYHPDNTKIVSYAASMQDDIPKCDEKQMASLLKNFDYISVRERTLVDKISRISGKYVYNVVDPTLLLNREQWNQLATKTKVKQPYLLLYQVEKGKKTEEIAREVATRKNLKIIRLCAGIDSETSKEVRTSSPSDFLGLFRDAEFIVCSSFHGTIFSLQYEKPFISVRMGKGKDNRVESLLEPLGLLKYYINDISEYNDELYSLNNNDLEKLKSNSFKYLDMVTAK